MRLKKAFNLDLCTPPSNNFVKQKLETSYSITKVKNSCLISASILVIGQVIGCLAGGPISDAIGRRRALLVFLSLSLIGQVSH